MANTIITSAGAQAATSAGPSGPYFAVKYFVPVYDERIDSVIHTTSASQQASVLAISASMSSGDTVPTGEIIYNLDGVSYEISETEVLYTTSGEVTATSGSDILVSGSDKNATVVYNYIDNTTDPIGPVITGSNFVPPASSGGNWLVTDYGVLTSAASATPSLLSDTDNMFPVSSYTPISSGANIRGMFKCRMNENVGDFKFNKIALYIVKVNEDGSIDTGFAPTLFAIAALETAVHKTTTGFNIANVEIDVELEFSPNATLSNLMFATNDNWWQVPGTSGIADAIFTDKDVAIGTSGVSWFPYAKLQITDATKPQQRLAYDASNASDVFVTSTGQRRTTTSGAGSSFGKDDNVASGEHSFAIGEACLADEERSFAAGYACSARATDMGSFVSISMGRNNYVDNGVAIGASCYVNGANGETPFTFGTDCSAFQSGKAMGKDIRIDGVDSVGLGRHLKVTGNYSMGIGLHTTVVQILSGSNVFGVLGGGMILGYTDNAAPPIGSLAIGKLNNSSGDFAVTQGLSNLASANYSFASGLTSSATNIAAIAMGSACSASGIYSYAQGGGNVAAGSYSFAVGNGCLASNTGAVAFGNAVSATGVNSYSFGVDSLASGDKSFVFGESAIATKANSFAFGLLANAVGIGSFAFGDRSIAGAGASSDCFAMGQLCSATGANSFAFGNTCLASAQNTFALGQYAQATGTNSFAIQLSGTIPIPVTATATLGIVGGNVWHREYTQLGPIDGAHPLIRVAKISFTMPAVGVSDNFAHNIADHTKILSVAGVCNRTSSSDIVIINNPIPTTIWTVTTITSTNIVVSAGTGATDVNGEAGTLLVTYEE